MAKRPPPPKAQPPSRPGTFSSAPRKMTSRVRLMDRVASGVIRFGGASVILAVAAIFVFVGREALPLFLPAKAKPVFTVTVPEFTSDAFGGVLGVDEYETYAYWLHSTGAVHLATLADQKTRTVLNSPSLLQHPLSAAYRSAAKDHLYLGTTDGHVLLAQLKFSPAYTAAGRTVTGRLVEEKLIRISTTGSPVIKVHGRHDSTGKARFAALCADGTLFTGSYEDGGDTVAEPVGGKWSIPVTTLALDLDGRRLFVATEDGQLHHWELDDSREKPYRVIPVGNVARTLTAMDFVIGDHALILGFSDGSVEQWFGVRENTDDVLRPFHKIRAFDSLPASVQLIQPSGRDKGFLAASRDGTIHLGFTTSGRTLLEFNAGGSLKGLAYAPKLTSILATTATNQMAMWELSNPHPEISFATLFGKVWYEGYDAPEFNWQSTGGTDDFESKCSLVPLIVGTLKGAFYGLLFAIPVAVMAAIYVSQFMSYRLRGLVKPAVEIMAALPSVVIGFLAGLWLAPMMENHVLSIGSAFILVPVLVLLAVTIWHHLPQPIRSSVPHGTELALLIPLVALGFFLATQLGPLLEAWFFHGDFRQWVFDTTGHQFEQRNSIVIGFAMGFAVIPIIFTISEDALSNVPQHFVSGSLALGASRWQTAARVILPTASPGIFSAIMVGFGRAVGETMIVLMATGNTPILSLSPFNGMRTLSANIAVEIPEAPVSGTLYRVLFLAAILLFIMTFVVNTVAEVIRQRLREKYKAV
ncbi:MAG: ABC transporter permease subunit [Verrucomicrobia bacterium]|nr:ABC transporter permease subunit [Verrucomicrobiota bacterium]